MRGWAATLSNRELFHYAGSQNFRTTDLPFRRHITLFVRSLIPSVGQEPSVFEAGHEIRPCVSETVISQQWLFREAYHLFEAENKTKAV